MNPTGKSDGSERSVAEFIVKEGRYQTAGRFYYRVAEHHLAILVESCVGRRPSEGEIARLLCLLKDASIKLLAFKWINGLCFFPALALALLALLMPLFQISGSYETVCIALAGAFGAVYAQYKRRQKRIEMAMRNGLCVKEPYEAKIHRLIEEIGASDSALRLPSPVKSEPENEK